jgi:hypothetical protein
MTIQLFPYFYNTIIENILHFSKNHLDKALGNACYFYAYDVLRFLSVSEGCYAVGIYSQRSISVAMVENFTAADRSTDGLYLAEVEQFGIYPGLFGIALQKINDFVMACSG